MFEARKRAYKQDLIEKARPHLGAGEQVRVLALAQIGVRPWVQIIPTAIGAALLVQAFNGNFPIWAGVLGVLIMLAGSVASFKIRRRLLLRTDERLYSFELPSKGASIKPPLGVFDLAELPPTDDGKPTLEGERLFPSFGANEERGPMVEATTGPPNSR